MFSPEGQVGTHCLGANDQDTAATERLSFPLCYPDPSDSLGVGPLTFPVLHRTAPLTQVCLTQGCLSQAQPIAVRTQESEPRRVSPNTGLASQVYEGAT